MSGSLDTSVLVQLVTGQTPELAAATVKLIERAEGQLAIADAALIELVFVLERLKGLERRHILVALETLSAYKKFNFNRPLFAGAMSLYVAHPALSIHDCCLAVYAKLNRSEPLWTFDRKLARQAGTAKLVPAKS